LKKFSEYVAERWRGSTQKCTGKQAYVLLPLPQHNHGKIGYARNKRTTEARSRNHFSRGKATSSTNSMCVFVALVIHHAKRMLRIILSFVACLALPCFSTLSHKRHDFLQKWLNIKCVFWFSIQFCLKHFSF